MSTKAESVTDNARGGIAMTKKEKQVEDDIVKQLRLEVRRALRERKLVEIILDPWYRVHGPGVYVNVLRDVRVKSFVFEP